MVAISQSMRVKDEVAVVLRKELDGTQAAFKADTEAQRQEDIRIN